MVDEVILEEEEIVEERTHEVEPLVAKILGQPIRVLPGLREPVSVPRGASVREAIARMNSENIGCVLVVDGGRLEGIFTERDVLTKIAATELDLDRTAVDDLMTAEPECLTLDDDIAFALNRMAVGGYRHVPLVDAQRRPTGVVAMRHIVEHLVDIFPREVLNLPPTPSHWISREREGA